MLIPYLSRYLYEIFITFASAGDRPPSTLLQPSRTRDLHHTLSVLQALGLLMDAETRLLGLLASKSALAPFMTALNVGPDSTWPPTLHEAIVPAHPCHTSG